MIPHLDTFLEHHRRGEMPINHIVAYVVKSIAVQGEASDYFALPTELRDEVAKRLAWYRERGRWFVLTSNGEEDYSGYAARCLEKIGEPDQLSAQHTPA